ncbi:GntR family transcriptional regulator [Rhodobacteraceae bacterium F11138]|nr:GntR family transcriptional regulator [Rhodobacteraceae bacterium F11138]
MIHDLLQDKIASGALPVGATLKEGTIAAHVGTSRAPVRRALRNLAKSGLIRAADGQGYIVGKGAAVPLSSRQLYDTLNGGIGAVDRTVSAERIVQIVHGAIVAVMPFGHYRILESELGEHFGVSRTVAREVLWRLMEQSYIHKDRKSHWIVPQLSARDIRETLQMRRALEPQALRLVAHGLPSAFLTDLASRIDAVLADFQAVTAPRIDAIEHDICHNLFEDLQNKRMLASIRRNQIPLVVPRIFRRNFPLRDDLAALRLYDRILSALVSGDVDAAARLLEIHLDRAEALMLARLRVLSVLPPPRTDTWLSAIH